MGKNVGTPTRGPSVFANSYLFLLHDRCFLASLRTCFGNTHRARTRPNMREAVTKCKVAILLLLSNAYQSALQAILFVPTRRRKLAAESAFCCQFVSPSSLLTARRYSRKVLYGKGSPENVPRLHEIPFLLLDCFLGLLADIPL